MIVITEVSVEPKAPPTGDTLILRASWLDGRRFTYEINARGLFVLGFGPASPHRPHIAIHHFAFVVHDDVWTLLVRERFRTIRRTWSNVCGLFRSQKRLVGPLDDDEIGTAFGVASHRELAEFLRGLGYRVDELRWSDLIRVPEAAPAT